jgi:CRISPR-associated protein Cmx8
MGKAKLPDQLVLPYSLSELPSSQHRAGLAGLVLTAQWLDKQPSREGLFDVKVLNEDEAVLTLDKTGFARAFGRLYEPEIVERVEPKARKKTDEPLVRTIEREIVKKGVTKTETHYVYEQVMPKGAWLEEVEPSGSPGLWVKVWREFVWSVSRGLPTQRLPYSSRRGPRKPGTPSDVEAEWKSLASNPEGHVELPSTYSLGTMTKTPEGMPVTDKARHRFLLHFWTLVASIYIPQTLDPHEETQRFGSSYVVAIPDIANLRAFCEALPDSLRQRDHRAVGYRPRGALISLPAEAALDMASRMRDRVAAREGATSLADLVLGYDVIEAAKDGNNVRVRCALRVDPEDAMIDDYDRLRAVFRDPFFRHRRLLNLVSGRPWYQGFPDLFRTIPYKTQGIGSSGFRGDARTAFQENMPTDEQPSEPNPEIEQSEAPKEFSLERTVYNQVNRYVHARLKAKYNLTYAEARDSDRLDDFNNRRQKVAKEAFLAIRSRTGAAFVDYFAGTLGSVPHRFSADRFVTFSRILRESPEDVRALTLLALSAVA